MKFTVLPFLMAMIVALAGMPTDVVQVCYGEMGHEHTLPWRSKALAAVRARGRSLMFRLQAMCAGWRGHPLAMPAAILAGVLLVSVIAPAHVHGASFAVVGTVSIKQMRQDKADTDKDLAVVGASAAKLRAEARGIFAVAADKRTAEQVARLTAIDTDLDKLTAQESELATKAETIATELARAERYRDEDVAKTPPAAVETKLTKERPVTLGEIMQAMVYESPQFPAHRKAIILPNGVEPRVAAVLHDPDMQAAASGASSGVPESGGVLVRNEWNTSLLARLQEEGKLAPRCFSMPIGDGMDGVEAPYIDETSRATGSRWGGVQVYRAAEAAAMTGAAPKLGRFDLRLEDLTGLFYATDRVLRDAVLLEALATKAFTSEAAFKLDDEIVRGTGAGQCLGVVGNAPTVSVAKEVNQAAGTVVYENIIKMYARLLARCVPGAEWFINQAVWPQLFKMSLSVGTGGVPAFLPPNGLSSSPFGTLMGLPINVIEQASAPGTVGDIILANFHNDYALISKPVMSASSIHVLFTSNQTTLRWVWPIIGKPVMASAVTPYKGADTLGPFVTLATRS